MIFSIFSNVFTNILKIYELPKTYNKIVCTMNLVYVWRLIFLIYMEINIFGRDRIIQIWIISSKDINTQCLCKIYCRELGQCLMQFDAFEKKCNETTNCSIATNSPIHLESNGLHIKVPLIFWFLIMIFYFCFYHQLWVKWLYIDIWNSSGHSGQTHSWFPKYVWTFNTEWNAHQFDILDNLFN